jgi:hypothetical protein
VLVADLDLVERRVKAGAVQSLFVAAGAAAVGVGLLAAAGFQVAHRQVGSAAFIALMALVAGAGALMLLSNARASWTPRATPVYAAFADHPERLVWAHEVVGKTNGVRVYLIDGSEHTLTANRDQSRELIQLVRARAPHAILGWGAEQKEAFRRRVVEARPAGR